jgi:hypothetical protein
VTHCAPALLTGLSVALLTAALKVIPRISCAPFWRPVRCSLIAEHLFRRSEHTV